MNPKNARYSTISPVLPATLDAFASNNNRSVFVRDLPFCCTTEELRTLFQREAEIELEDAVICRNNEGKTLQYGCVMFYQEDDVDKVIDKLNGFRYHGRDIRIIKYNKDAMMESSSTGAVLVSFKGTNQELELITEATIRAAFEQFGEISHVSIRSHLYNSYGIQGGFGFLGFVDSSVNDRVVAEINQTVLGGVQYDCNWSKHMNKNAPGSDGVGYPADGNSFFKRKNNNNNANSSQKENSSRYGQHHQYHQPSNQNYSHQQQTPQPLQPMHYLYSTFSKGPFVPTYNISPNMPSNMVTSGVYPPMYANPIPIPMSTTMVEPNMNLGMMIPGQNGGFYVPSTPGILPTETMQTNPAAYTHPHMQQTYPAQPMSMNMQPSSHVPQQQLSSQTVSASNDGNNHTSGMRPASSISSSSSSLPSPQSRQTSSHRAQHSNFTSQTAPSVSSSLSPIISHSPVQFHPNLPYQQTQQQQKHALAPQSHSHPSQQQGSTFSTNHPPTRANKGKNNSPASSTSSHGDSAPQQPVQQHHHHGMTTNATQSTYPSSSPQQQQQQFPSHQQPQLAVANHQGNYPSHPNPNSASASPHLLPMMPSPAQSQLPQSIQQQQQSLLSQIPLHPSPYQQSFTAPAPSVNHQGIHSLPSTYSSPHLTHTSLHMCQPPPQQLPQPAASFSVPVVPPPLPAAMGYMSSPQPAPMQQHHNQQSPPISYPPQFLPTGVQYSHVQHPHVMPPPPMQQQQPMAMVDASSTASIHNSNMMVYQATYPYATPANGGMYSAVQPTGMYMTMQQNAQSMKAHMPANNAAFSHGYYTQPQN